MYEKRLRTENCDNFKVFFRIFFESSKELSPWYGEIFKFSIWKHSREDISIRIRITRENKNYIICDYDMVGGER